MSQEDPHGGAPRADAASRLDAARQELQELHQRMDAIKQELADEVDRQWTSMWRSPEMFNLKVSTRLSGHEEYRSLIDRVREVKRVEAALAAELDRGATENESG